MNKEDKRSAHALGDFVAKIESDVSVETKSLWRLSRSMPSARTPRFVKCRDCDFRSNRAVLSTRCPRCGGYLRRDREK